MQKIEEDIYAVLSRYLAKRTIKGDDEKLQSWLNASNENRLLFEKLENYWNSAEQKKVSILRSDEIKKDIWERANRRPLRQIEVTKGKNIFVRYAAAFLLLIGAISVVYFYEGKDAGEQSNVRIISKLNNAGRKSTIYLKDGTIVNLNSESRISYHEAFSDSVRIVWLSGEAFFHVAHDPEKPFYVITQNVKVEAIGTSFDVCGYPDDDIVKVSLNSGKVLVDVYDSLNWKDNSKEIELMPGQQVSFQKSSNIFSPVTSYDPIEVEGWKDGILCFKHAGVDKIIKSLERWYGVDIQVIGSVKEISYTGLFKRQNLENVLASIEFATGIKFRINNEKVLSNNKN